MNLKFGLVMGAAVACAVMTGCKAPKAQTSGGTTTMEPTRPVRATTVTTVDEKPVARSSGKAHVDRPALAGCTCAPGTVHDSPCTCGAADCKCKVKAKVQEPEYTEYRVKGGDMLSAICKRYGLKQSAVLKLNPGLNPNRLIAGKKIKLPGVIDLKEGDAQQGAAVKPATGAKGGAAGTKAAAEKKGATRVSSYKGATKEYVVKNGDFLGKIAAENGITVKCLKEMNGLKNNNIRVGQKLKVPAEKPVAEVKKAETKKDDAAAAKPVAEKKDDVKADNGAAEQKAPDAEPKDGTKAAAETKPADEQKGGTDAAAVTEEAPAAGPLTHTVKDGEDIVSIAIQYNISPSSLLDLNGLTNNSQIPGGTVLKLPPNAKKQ